MSRLETFRRAIGLKPTFRRSGSAHFVNLAVGAVVGMVSGNYLFKEPLKEYWEEQDSLKSSPAPNGGPTSVASSNAK